MIISRKAFEAWLRTNPTRTFAPEPFRDSKEKMWVCGCPIAKFAQQHFAAPNTTFNSMDLTNYDTWGTYPQPKWTHDFAHEFDNSKHYTATRALEILDNLP